MGKIELCQVAPEAGAVVWSGGRTRWVSNPASTAACGNTSISTVRDGTSPWHYLFRKHQREATSEPACTELFHNTLLLLIKPTTKTSVSMAEYCLPFRTGWEGPIFSFAWICAVDCPREYQRTVETKKQLKHVSVASQYSCNTLCHFVLALSSH